VQNYTYLQKRRNIRIKYQKNEGKKSPLRTIIVVVGIFAILTIFVQLYVMSIFATKGKDIVDLEIKKTTLVKENKELQESIARSKNIDYLKNQSKELGFVDVKPNEIKYLRIGE
jgi:hypothetical protein